MADTERSTKGDNSVITPGIYYPPTKQSYRGNNKHRKRMERVVFKSGEINVERFSHNKFSFITFWFITMVEARWRWTLLNFGAAFTGSWLFFASIYWLIALIHTDLDENHLPPNQTTSDWEPCIEHIYGFTSTLLFSVEVHTTVAYGKRSITLKCPDAIFTMCMQCITSSIIQAFMVGILFAKLTRPKARAKTILFSKTAVICLKDDKLCLEIRVGDMRKSRILDIKPSLYIMRLNAGGNFLNEADQFELKAKMDGCESTFFMWPVSVIHIIDSNSPLYKISAADLLKGRIEILAVFEGTIESTGQPVQARTSYLENDILWGHRFVSLVNYNKEKEMYDVDYSKMSETKAVEAPLCSACEYKSLVTLIGSNECDNYTNDFD